ncbi:MAG TPA: PDZ domain-containing protein [Chitinophagaceae bacterium]|jgi:tricorn protease|nr:PDZ domain-containing protein [Chitinophagaceae bacterium]
MKKIIACLAVSVLTLRLFAQIDAGLFRFPDVSQTQIVFTYANDLWLIPKEGGTAIKLSSPAGVESYPKFSPDGKSIAFSGNYDGNNDAYTISVTGGVPVRLTSHGYSDRVVDWTTDGKKVLFASGRESGKSRYNQFYTVPANGGVIEKLPLAYAEYGSYSPDGKQIAVVFRTQVGRNWKRYRGGWKADIQLFNFANNESKAIGVETDAGSEFPMWHGNTIYFISDRGTELRMNLWKYDLDKKTYTQLTNFKDHDVHYPSLGPDDIVFEAGGKMYLYSISSGKQKTVDINVITDKAMLKPKIESAEKLVQQVSLSPDGNRVLIQARGDVFSVPAENGYVKDMTRTSGAAERYPAWSPDGKHIAYWSDQSGEYELWLMETDKENARKKLTDYGAGYRYRPFWSPDSKKIAFIDKAMRIKIFDITTNQTTEVDRALRYTHGALEGFTVSWSPDSRWMAYARDLENQHNAIYIYDYTNKKNNTVTKGFYECNSPVFDPEGKYLYFYTNQSFKPDYSDVDNTFIYSNTTQIAVVSLRKETPSLLAPKNDTVAMKSDDMAKDEKEKNKKDSVNANNAKAKAITIDFDGIEQRLELLPAPAGNYNALAATKGKIIFLRYPNTGAPDAKGILKYWDIEKKEEKTILDGIDNARLSANGQKILVTKSGSFAVITPNENQKFEKPLALADMQMMVDPVQEWKQIFMDVWRFERDYFYDAGMHGVDWKQAKDRYLKMFEGAMTREEADFIIGELIGELNASHTYHGGGDIETPKNKAVGYLGVDWQADGNNYKIKKIIRGAPWDAEVRSSLDQPGVTIKEGEYILAVNGVPLTTSQEPFVAFTGLANKTVELTYNSKPSWDGAKTVIVKTMDDEYRLRNLAWIEDMRKQVDEETNGEAGYIFVPSTGVDGQNELIRQFNAQWDKKALVIDERFNNGGQIPDRFIEMLNRDPLAFWAIRDGSDWPWPPYANFGPKVMLINGWSGSGGDAFPDYFRRKKLGPLIGARTWGGLIGISGVPGLVDGGGVTVPTFRMYNPDGTWFQEGHGVDPDIAVPEDLGMMAKGKDPQLQKGIEEIKNLLKTKGYKPPARPALDKKAY